jgi:hypothetical protein
MTFKTVPGGHLIFLMFQVGETKRKTEKYGGKYGDRKYGDRRNVPDFSGTKTRERPVCPPSSPVRGPSWDSCDTTWSRFVVDRMRGGDRNV